jgi:hypothetical protein
MSQGVIRKADDDDGYIRRVVNVLPFKSKE